MTEDVPVIRQEGSEATAADGPSPAPSGSAPDTGPDPAGELARVSEERAEYLDALQRLKAEFDNYRKRSDRDRQALAAGATREVVRDLLPVIDNLERAVAALGGSEGSGGVLAGVEMVHGQLTGLVASRGVVEIEALGREFDPSVHEAVMAAPSADHPEGTVIDVVQRGYRHDDVVLRPSRVVVAAAPAPGG